jgi:hypothetical protein
MQAEQYLSFISVELAAMRAPTAHASTTINDEASDKWLRLSQLLNGLRFYSYCYCYWLL